MGQIRYDLTNGITDFDTAHSLYHTWKNLPSYAIFVTPGYNPAVDDLTRSAQNNYIYKKSNNKYRPFKPHYYENYIAVKLMKRGNDVYCKKLSKKLQPLENICLNYPKTSLLKQKERTLKTSNILRFDFTYDTNRCKPKTSAKNIGAEYNLFLSNLKKHFGSISEFRCLEFTKKGYAHIHAIFVFHDKRFRVTPMVSKKNNKLYYRVTDGNLNKFRKHWHSNINVYALENTRQLRYIMKYLSKDFFDHTDSITPFLLSLYSNRAYAISRNFIPNINSTFATATGVQPLRLDYIKYNSNPDMINIQFLGTFSTKIDFPKWLFHIKPPPYEFWNENGKQLQTDLQNPDYFN